MNNLEQALKTTRAMIEGSQATGDANPYIFSSPCWMAWECGRNPILQAGIEWAKTSRGYSIKCKTRNGLFHTTFAGPTLSNQSCTLLAEA